MDGNAISAAATSTLARTRAGSTGPGSLREDQASSAKAATAKVTAPSAAHGCQARKRRRRSGTGPPSSRATRSAKKDHAAETREQAVKKCTVSSTVPGQWGQHGDGASRRRWRRTCRGRILCKSENITSAAAADREGPAILDQAIRQGRSGWRHSTFGGGREEVNWA